MALYRNIAGFDLESGTFDSLINPLDTVIHSLDPSIVLPPLVPPTVFYDPGVPIPPPQQPIPDKDPILTPTTEIPITATNTAGTPQVLPLPDTEKAAIDWLPLLTLGGLFATVFLGEKHFPKKQKVVFVAGLGALYYQFSKRV